MGTTPPSIGVVTWQQGVGGRTSRLPEASLVIGWSTRTGSIICVCVYSSREKKWQIYRSGSVVSAANWFLGWRSAPAGNLVPGLSHNRARGDGGWWGCARRFMASSSASGAKGLKTTVINMGANWYWTLFNGHSTRDCRLAIGQYNNIVSLQLEGIIIIIIIIY